MDDSFRELLRRSTSAIDASAAMLARMEQVNRSLDRQIHHSRALIRDARRLLAQPPSFVPGSAPCVHVWRLKGDGAYPVDCTIEQVGPSAFRVLVARNAQQMMAERFVDSNAAGARAQQLGSDLIKLGWVADGESAS